MTKSLATLLLAAVIMVFPGDAQAFWPFPKKKKEAPKVSVSVDAPAKPKSDNGLKPFREIITKDAKSSYGMFGVHRVKDKYFFELPDSVMGRDVLIVGRITRSSADNDKEKTGYPGDQISEEVIRFDKAPAGTDKVFIRSVSYIERSSDSLGMYTAVRNSNIMPIMSAFDIKTSRKDTVSGSRSWVIDVTDYIKGDKGIFSFDERVKKSAGLGAIQSDASFIDTIKVFPLNVEVRVVKTFARAPVTSPSPLAQRRTPTTPLTYELNTSMVMLPKEPMRARYYDPRVGYFATGYTDFDANPQGVEYRRIITRWRLEPKPEDLEKYKRGELVEPAKPIVIYIDPATPKKWVPYLMAGVNDWQKAFEHAGFKNAIYALEAPDDPSWSLEDARHSAIVYKPSNIANASGPHVHDPRSGEIIETHINWYHNVMELLRSWYMIQAGPVDPGARQMVFDDELMGQLIRFVSSHEVGHTLGLRHNFGSSSTVPVEKLRDKAWVEANGHTPSIMDYARFNYVAQPEDNIGREGLFPRIGIYDNWSIEWGYRYLPQFATADDEIEFNNRSVIERLASDRRYFFGSESTPDDPRNQSEDMGDNAMIASAYGIKNLQRIMPNLFEWTRQDNKDYSSAIKLYVDVVGQYQRYMGHVTTWVGGVFRTPRTVEEPGNTIEFAPAARQKEAVEFLNRNLFETPKWLVNKEFMQRTGIDPTNYICTVQGRMIDRLISRGTIDRMTANELYNGTAAYRVSDMMRDLKKGVWGELTTGRNPDVYRRNLQKTYVNALIALAEKSPLESSGITIRTASLSRASASDAAIVAREQLTELRRQLNAAAASSASGTTRAHYQNLATMIGVVLDMK